MSVFDVALYDLYHKHGHLSHRVARIERRQETEMSQVEELTAAVSDLKNNLASKFGEIQAELDKLESEKASGSEPDLTALKDMVTGLDQEVGAFNPTAGDTTPAGGGTAPAPGEGGTPAGGGTPAEGGTAPAGGAEPASGAPGGSAAPGPGGV